jgi:2-polyprenyl-3-methyl-5-hydroxy-6-metoxy-1,4-benzoquinol methylase
LPNITFTVVDVTKLKPSKPYDHILFIDLVHHLPDGEQVKLLDRLWDGLKPKGIMIMKDVDTKPTWKYLWNYIHDSLMAGPPLTYYPSDYYINYFRSKGGLVTYYKPTNFHSPYNHYALKILKP